jgi:hypothetical protein
MQRRQTLTALVCLAFVATSCAGGGSGASNVSGPGSGQLAAALLPVTPVASTTGSVSGLLTPDAPLVLDTVGPDGAKFHAEFAKGAAPFIVTVTMRPLLSVGGFTGNVEGVTFEPSGVYLIQPAVLTIDGPVANARGARAFGYQATDAGALARPVIMAPADGPMRLLVTHFSGYGSAGEDPPQWNIGTITATEARDIIALEDFVIANTLRLLKSHDLSDAEAQQALDNALNGIADAAKRLGDSALATAEKGSPDAASQVDIGSAIEVILASERADQLSGRAVNSEAMSRVVAIVKTYLAGVTKHCQTAHDLTVLTLLFSLTRQVQLLGADDSTESQELGKCASAKVHFHTTINVSMPPSLADTGATYGGDMQFDVTAPVDLFYGASYEGVPYTISTTVVFHDNTCTATETVDGGSFSVPRASLMSAAPPAAPPPPPAGGAQSSKKPGVPVIPALAITDALVQVSIGNPAIHDNAGPECGPQSGTQPSFSDIYDQLHHAEALGSGVYLFSGGFEIPGGGSAVLARRTIDRTRPSYAEGIPIYTSTTIIEIIHTPG